jgi:hypothetical protein
VEVSLEKLDENRVEKALIYLADTDKPHADLGGEVKRLEEGIKQAQAHEFLLADGTVAEREAKAKASLKFNQAVLDHIQAYKDFKLIDNQRNHEIRIIDIWRTLSSNRRQGSI